MATMNLHMPAAPTTLPGAIRLPAVGALMSALVDKFEIRVERHAARVDLAVEQSKMNGQAKARFWI